MLVVIKKYKFFIRKADFVRFIIKLKKNQHTPKESRSYSKLVETREHYIVKIVSRVLQLL